MEAQSENRKARYVLLAKADARALQEAAKKKPVEPAKPKVPIVGGGEAGLNRVIGAGKPAKKPVEKPVEKDEVAEHAKQQGCALAKYIHELRGGAYLQHFTDALRTYAPASSPAEVRRTGMGEPRPVSVEIINNVVPAPEPPKKRKRIAKPNDKRQARGALMRRLMKEQGMSFADASRHIKQHGLM